MIQKKLIVFFRLIKAIRNNPAIVYLWIFFIFFVSLLTAFLIPSYITFTDNPFIPIEVMYLAYALPTIYAFDFMFSLFEVIYLWKNISLEKKTRIRLIIKLFFSSHSHVSLSFDRAFFY